MPKLSRSQLAFVSKDNCRESGALRAKWEEWTMRNVVVMLAAGALALVPTAGRAEDQPAPVPPAEAAVAPTPAPACGTCAASCGSHCHSGCRHVWEWLTYCPLRTACCSCHPHLRACE